MSLLRLIITRVKQRAVQQYLVLPELVHHLSKSWVSTSVTPQMHWGDNLSQLQYHIKYKQKDHHVAE